MPVPSHKDEVNAIHGNPESAISSTRNVGHLVISESSRAGVEVEVSSTSVGIMPRAAPSENCVYLLICDVVNLPISDLALSSKTM